MMWLWFVMIVSVAHAHISSQFPLPRDKLNGADYLKWQQNEPMYSVHPTVCHSLDVDDTVRSDNIFQVGDEIVFEFYGTAVHDGGHCAWWYSTDDVTFTKIIDEKDCTLKGPGETKILVPETMPAACTTKCTWAWTWTPFSSGLCEIYMNCADIQVTDATGAAESDAVTVAFQDLIDSNGCQRVDETTHWTTHFGSLKTNYSAANGEANGNEEEIDSEEAEATEEGGKCYGSGARDLDGEMSLTDGDCTCDGCRCDDGMCCSSYGYCGPELKTYDGNGDPLYCDYDSASDCSIYYESEEVAYDAYCTDNDGDWRISEENCGDGSGDDDAAVSLSTGVAWLVALLAPLCL